MGGDGSPFRSAYLDYEALTRVVEGWASAHPDLVRLESLATTREGRSVWLLTIGHEPERIRPGVWVDGNLHASELAGSSVALSIAEDALRLVSGEARTLHGLPEHVVERLGEVLFYVCPRISPDGAEAVLKTGRYVRSVPRDPRPGQHAARWVAEDVDGDGLALLMRKVDPAGDYVESKEVLGLMLPRQLEDQPPYYKVWPEGRIENFDGHRVPDPIFLSDNGPDLNRNFPWSWQPEPTQVGAGPFPGSEPETRAILDFATRHPNLFAWLNLHTFGGVFIRPLGAAPDTKLDPWERALFRQLEAWGQEIVGYPMVSGYEEFTYEPEKPIHGDLSDFAWHVRGCIAYVCELWDLFAQVGIERKKPFVDTYSHLDRSDLVRLGRWDQEHNRGRVLRPWKPVVHPQLGEVEVGGLDPRVGLWNPPPEKLPELCERQSAMWMRVAALLPQIAIDPPEPQRHGDLTRVELCIRNEGYLPTYGTPTARQLPWNEPLHLTIHPRGPKLVDPEGGRLEVGHLSGWGRGRFGGAEALYALRSLGTGNARRLAFTVEGHGTVEVRVGSCRLGARTLQIEV